MTSGDGQEQSWVEESASMVRPYMMIGGRTRATHFDPLAFVVADGPSSMPQPGLNPEHAVALELCQQPLVVAELAARLDLPVNVVRVLLDDLLDRGLVSITEDGGDQHLNVQVLERVLRGLRSL